MAKTGYGNFDYTCQGNWRGTPHQFHVAGNHSGSAFSAADAPTFMTGDASPYVLSIGPFQAPVAITVVEARYYNGSDSAPIWEASYDTDNPAPDNLTATGLAYNSDPDAYTLPLECCCIVEAIVGINSKSKPIYCRKYLRGIPYNGTSDESGTSELTITTAGNEAATAFGNGTWYGNRVYISPSGRQGTAGWNALTQIGNHQVPRGKKRKATSATGQSVIKSAIAQLESGAAGASVALLLDTLL